MAKRKNYKDKNQIFDSTMERKHWAEMCDLIGQYVLRGLKNTVPNWMLGLYRDDRLIAKENKLSNVLVEIFEKHRHKS